jgi:hypothetical protein
VAQQLADAVKTAKVALEQAQNRAKTYANQHRREVNFDVGDRVLVSTKNLKLKVRKDTKLLPKYVGPVTIVRRIGPVAYKVELPHQWKVHDVFHVSLLRPYIQRGDAGYVAAPPTEWLENEPLYEVEAILDHVRRPTSSKTRKKRFATRYLIKWKNYDHLYNSWEPEKNMVNCKDILAEYWTRVNAKSSC